MFDSGYDGLTIGNGGPSPPGPAGLTTPPSRAASTTAVQGTPARSIDFEAAADCRQPEAAAQNDNMETASLPEPTRAMGGDGGPLGEEVEQAEPPTTQCNRQGDAPQPPHATSSENIRSNSAPAEPSRAEAPATSPPPVDSQPTPPPFKFDANWEVPSSTSSKGPPFKFEVPLTFDSRQAQVENFIRECQEELTALLATEQSIKDFSSWQLGHQQEERRKIRPEPWPDARLPYEWRYGERAWRAVELYDRWLRGEVLKAGEEGEFEDAIECGEVEVKGLPEAELVNHILAAALRYDLCLGDDGLEGEVDREAFPEWWGKAPAVDARHPVSSLNNRLALAMHHILHPYSNLCYWFQNSDPCWVVEGVASQPPPSPAELMREMVEAAKAGLRKQHLLDKQKGRGFVQYPMRVGEPERSGWRDYDDGSAGNAAKYDDARADDDNLGDNDDDRLSDFSDDNSDGQCGA